jgi:hypothetical protein
MSKTLISWKSDAGFFWGGKGLSGGGRRRGKKKGRKRKEEDSLSDENPSVRIPFEECLSKT